jgi:hypothetical protein
MPEGGWIGPVVQERLDRLGRGGHGRRRHELAAGQHLGQPDLPSVHAPGHGHHPTGEPRGPESQQTGHDRVPDARRNRSDHDISLIKEPFKNNNSNTVSKQAAAGCERV